MTRATRRPSTTWAWRYGAGTAAEAIVSTGRASPPKGTTPICTTTLETRSPRPGRSPKRETALRRARRYGPIGGRRIDSLGSVLASQGRVREGLEHLRRAVALAPKSADRVRPGHAAARGGRTREAIGALDEAVRLAPNDAAAHNNRGIALGSVGRLDEARRAFDARSSCSPASRTRAGTSISREVPAPARAPLDRRRPIRPWSRRSRRCRPAPSCPSMPPSAACGQVSGSVAIYDDDDLFRGRGTSYDRHESLFIADSQELEEDAGQWAPDWKG